MQSKNKKPPTVAEREHIARVAALPCVVCGVEGVEVHEIVQGNWWLACALCPDCHRGSFNGLHGQKRIWSVKKMTELDALAETIRGLSSGMV